jgi:hypothetical protein
MAIGWMTVLKLVPWGEVIKNAPVVADGAKKLWDSVGRKPAPPRSPAARPAAAGGAVAVVPNAAAALQAQLAETEAAVAQLQAQMQASSELIKALAEQNAELVRRVEIHRVRWWWLLGLVVVFVAIAGLNLAVTLSGGG